MPKRVPPAPRYRPIILRVSSADPIRFEFLSLFDSLVREPRTQEALVRQVASFVGRSLRCMNGGAR